MRRRQAFALAGRSPEANIGWLKNADCVPGRVFQGEIASVQGMTITSAKKGVCPTCGKHIGKGIAMHVRHCK